METRFSVVLAVLVLIVATVSVAGSSNSDVSVTDRYTLDFPVGSCGGFSENGVRWTAPEAMTVDIRGGAWRPRGGREAVLLSMWVNGEQLIKNILVHATSKRPYSFGRMIADQGRGSSGEQNFAHIVSQQGEDHSLLTDVSLEAGDEVYVQLGGGNFVGLKLTVGQYDLSKDFSNENNPNGPWAYGRVTLDDSGKPSLTLFDSNSKDFTPAVLPKGQQAWVDSTRPVVKARIGEPGQRSMMKLDGTISMSPEIRYDNGPNIYVEAIVNGRWEGLYWSADNHMKYDWEYWVESDFFDNNAFELVVNGQLISENWTVADHGEIESDAKGKHYFVELLNSQTPIKVRVHTLMDGTPIYQRWLEITNLSDEPIAINSVSPWIVKMMARADYKAEYAGDIKHAFRLGNFTKSEHRYEGWFEWQELSEGVTKIGSQNGLCWDDPFFIIRNEIRGQYLIGELAWPTDWEAELYCKEDIVYMARPADVLTLKIGPKSKTPLCVLSPNETTRSPAVHMGYVSGDLDSAVQAMHEHVRRSVLPSQNPETARLIQYTVPGDHGYSSLDFGDPSNFTEDQVKKRVDIAEAIGAELFIVDARWWDKQGDWYPSKTRFPNGIKPIADYVHEKGMLFGLYTEIERAGLGCDLLEEHPEWHGPGDVLNIHEPEVYDYVCEESKRVIEEYDLDLFRIDFNAVGMGVGPGANRIKDGLTENIYWRYYEKAFDLYERIHEEYPDVIMQQCSCGAARNDYATVSRFHESYLTDGLRIPRIFQVFSGQSLALPPEILMILAGADGCYSVGTSEDLETYFRATFTLGAPFIFEGMTARNLDELSPVIQEGFLKYGKIYKEFIRPMMSTSKVYHHDPVNRLDGVDTSPWFAVEFTNPEGTKGWATLAKIGGTDTDEYIFKPRGFKQGKTYEITIDSTGEKVVVDGVTLARDGMLVRLDAIGHSELLLFEEK